MAYKWIALSNTTLGILLATVNQSIVIISLPAIFRGIGLDPLAPGNTSYLLWMLMGYLLVSAVLVVTLGRLGDMLGRVKIYNLGFVVFTLASILLSVEPFSGSAGAIWLIAFRVVQGVGGAMLMANSTAILTDAFSADGARDGAGDQPGRGAGRLVHRAGRGRAALGVELAGDLPGQRPARGGRHDLGVPVAGGDRGPAGREDRLVGQPDVRGRADRAAGRASRTGSSRTGGRTEGWTNPWVLAGIVGGIALLGAFVAIEARSAAPMFSLGLFRIRAFAAGNIANLLSAIARGGMQFMLIIWLQGIWLPLHGYDFEQTPLWAGIYLLPLTIGFLAAGPLAGRLSDRHGARILCHRRAAAGGGDVPGAAAAADRLLVLAVRGADRAERGRLGAVRGAEHRLGDEQRAGLRAGRGLRHGRDVHDRRHRAVDRRVLLAADRRAGPVAAGARWLRPAGGGVPADAARRPPGCRRWAACSPRSSASTRCGRCSARASLNGLQPDQAARITGQRFFPELISAPVHSGLVVVFLAAAGLALVAAVASALRGDRYVHADNEAAAVLDEVSVPAVAADPTSVADPA